MQAKFSILRKKTWSSERFFRAHTNPSKNPLNIAPRGSELGSLTHTE